MAGERIYPKFIARYLFGRKIGATLMVDSHTECGTRGKGVSGLSIAGVLSTLPLVEIRTGKKEGGWQVTHSRVKGDKVDAIIAEQACEDFARNLSGVKLLEAAALMGVQTEAELKEKVMRRILDPNWHMRVDEDDPKVTDLEEWVTADWARKHPLPNGEGNQEDCS